MSHQSPQPVQDESEAAHESRFLQLDLAPKRVDLLKEAVPAISRVAILSNPDHAGDASELRATRDAARQGGLAIEHFQVRADDSFEPAFAAISQSGCNALLTFPDALTFFHRRAIADFAVRRRLPSIFGWKPYVEAGGMMSYGPILNWSSTSRPRRHLGWSCHGFCSSAPTR